jgi:NAD(P)-dependent dehydrogenase (short-subunit alcohol dehydrogenase family)
MSPLPSDLKEYSHPLPHTRRVAVVTGGSSGLGEKIIERLLATQTFERIYNWSLETGVDVRDINSIRRAVATLSGQESRIDVLVNCAGVNRIEHIPKLEENEFDDIMAVNARSLFLVTKVLLLADEAKKRDTAHATIDGKISETIPFFSGGTICNIVSNASHMPMTSSLAYNASKGAAAIITKQMSRELIKTHGITVFAVSPNRLSGTKMSEYIDAKVMELRGWTLEQAQEYQRATLPAGKETDAGTLAEFIAFLLSTKERHRYLAGCDIQYGL